MGLKKLDQKIKIDEIAQKRHIIVMKTKRVISLL